jgi:ABC-type Zn uptake system ZnuABC Zn-binding protein ZnuA
MKKISVISVLLCLLLCLVGCTSAEDTQIVATTKPVYQFTSILCQNTPINVELLISDNVSCLHDYTLQVSQMQKLEEAELIVINGAGFEDFLSDVLPAGKQIVDCSQGIALHCNTQHSHDDTHSHETDPHIWLSIPNAKKMAQTIYTDLCVYYPEYEEIFANNHNVLVAAFSSLEKESSALTNLSNKEIITFHDGFSYLADMFNLHIVKAIEEESGSEASARELIEIIREINTHSIPAIFTEVSGSASAPSIIQAETNVKVSALDMGLSERDYFEAMKYNILTLKEALE